MLRSVVLKVTLPTNYNTSPFILSPLISFTTTLCLDNAHTTHYHARRHACRDLLGSAVSKVTLATNNTRPHIIL